MRGEGDFVCLFSFFRSWRETLRRGVRASLGKNLGLLFIYGCVLYDYEGNLREERGLFGIFTGSLCQESGLPNTHANATYRWFNLIIFQLITI